MLLTLWLLSVRNKVILISDDDTVYAWGYNEAGQLGIKTEIGIELYETANFPTKVFDDKLKGKKIVDFDVGENVTVLLTST